MMTGSKNELMLALLSNYQQLLVRQLVEYGLVGEYLTDVSTANARLLCQMRSIAFLCKTANWLDLKNIQLAEKLYVNAEHSYFKENKWLQKLGGSQEATLYNYAFVLLAQSYLYKATKNPLYQLALAETFSLVERKFQGQSLFKPLDHLSCLEQNSAMHLYEALTFAFYQADAQYMKQAISDLEQTIVKTFWQQDKGLLAEKVDFSSNVLSYEAGHWFEWVTLLWRVRYWRGETFIDPSKLFQSAITHVSFTEQGLLLNEMDSKLIPQKADQIRIWPNLEYLRARYFMGQSIDQVIVDFTQLFFDGDGLPIEYLGANEQLVKSTTGYHIAESFIDIMTAF